MKRPESTIQIQLNGLNVWVTASNTFGNERLCKQCNQLKPFIEFPYHKQTSNGQHYLKSKCIKCNSLSSRNWNLANLDKHQKYKLKYNLSFYGITPEEYKDKLEEQDHVCEICKQPPSQGRSLLSVDHDHSCCPRGRSCGKCVRGLLCEDCNKAIGILKENKETLKAAIVYLTKYERKQNKC